MPQTPSFSTRTPDILNGANMFSFAMPVINTGSGRADNVVLRSVSLGPAAVANPALPLPLGDLAVDNVTSVNASFWNNNLMVGRKYLAVVRGTYESGGTTYGFSLNRFIPVPPPVVSPVPTLAAHVMVSVNPNAGSWSYALFNNEPAESPLFINAFSLDMAAPFVVTQTPPGWAVDTDNTSYVLWFAADEQLPYPHHVPPGANLGIFQIQSARNSSEGQGFIITSWNHQADDAGFTTAASVLAPSRT